MKERKRRKYQIGLQRRVSAIEERIGEILSGFGLHLLAIDEDAEGGEWRQLGFEGRWGAYLGLLQGVDSGEYIYIYIYIHI